MKSPNALYWPLKYSRYKLVLVDIQNLSLFRHDTVVEFDTEFDMSSYDVDIKFWIKFYIEVSAKFDPKIDVDIMLSRLPRMLYRMRPQSFVKKLMDFAFWHLFWGNLPNLIAFMIPGFCLYGNFVLFLPFSTPFLNLKLKLCQNRIERPWKLII